MTWDWLGMAARPRAPRPGLKDEVLARAHAAGHRRRVPWLPLAAAATLLVALGAGWRALDRAQRQARAGEAALAAARDTLDLLRRPGARVYHIPIVTDGRRGTVTIFADSASHRWLVACHDMSPNAPGETYQIWFVTETGTQSAMLMPMHDATPMMSAVALPVVRVVGAAMSVEPVGGSAEMRGPAVFRVAL